MTMYPIPVWNFDATRSLTRRELATVLADPAKKDLRAAGAQRHRIIVRLGCYCWFALLSLAAPNVLPAAERPAVPCARPSGRGAMDADALAAAIDRFTADRWAVRKVQPAPLADDAEFIRRVYLDLVGCIPSIIDARDFLDDTRLEKRRIWVEELLTGQRPAAKPAAYARHFTNVWRAWILEGAGAQAQPLAASAETWLHERLTKNERYDRMVHELIAPPPGTVSIFDQGNEDKPENLAASTARLFLGIKLECAQCHDDRSGGNWTRTQFWELAAFFADSATRDGKPTARAGIVIPGKDVVVAARLLDGRQPAWSPERGVRSALADWLTSPDNPYFARAGVNRTWEYFFGTGLVEPGVEQGNHNPASHPELLDALAAQFVAHHFDLKYLVRTITLSRVYQLSSGAGSAFRHAASGGGGVAVEPDPRLFARRAVRGLTAEQLFDSLTEATEYSAPLPPRARDGPRTRFIERFANLDRPTEMQTSVLQALYMMNSRFMTDRTSPDHNRTLATIAGAGRITTQRRIEQLYLVTLSRKPRLAELERLAQYVDAGGAAGDRHQALVDIYWALLNSAEFRLNH